MADRRCMCAFCSLIKEEKAIIDGLLKGCDVFYPRGTMELEKIISDAWTVAEQHGFHEQWNTGEKIALMHSELSEALEEFRNGNAGIYTHPDNPKKPEGTAVELADLLIRLADFVEQEKLTVDFLKAIELKMTYNRTRPFKHGKKF